MAELTTTPSGIWVLQALLGVEKMPTALRLRPFVPSIDGGGTVATDIGEIPLEQTAEYASLAAAGVIDERGQVDEAVRDWMAVVGRPQREVMVVIRRPKPFDGSVRRRRRPTGARRGAHDVDLSARALAGHDRPQRRPGRARTAGRGRGRRRSGRVDLRHRAARVLRRTARRDLRVQPAQCGAWSRPSPTPSARTVR